MDRKSKLTGNTLKYLKVIELGPKASSNPLSITLCIPINRQDPEFKQGFFLHGPFSHRAPDVPGIHEHCAIPAGDTVHFDQCLQAYNGSYQSFNDIRDKRYCVIQPRPDHHREQARHRFQHSHNSPSRPN